MLLLNYNCCTVTEDWSVSHGGNWWTPCIHMLTKNNVEFRVYPQILYWMCRTAGGQSNFLVLEGEFRQQICNGTYIFIKCNIEWIKIQLLMKIQVLLLYVSLERNLKTLRDLNFGFISAHYSALPCYVFDKCIWINFSSWQDRTLKKIREEHEIRKWNNCRSHVRKLRGESGGRRQSLLIITLLGEPLMKSWVERYEKVLRGANSWSKWGFIVK